MWGEIRGVGGKLLRIKYIKKKNLKSICRLTSVPLYFRCLRRNLFCWQTQSLNMNIKMYCRKTFLKCLASRLGHSGCNDTIVSCHGRFLPMMHAYINNTTHGVIRLVTHVYKPFGVGTYNCTCTCVLTTLSANSYWHSEISKSLTKLITVIVYKTYHITHN